MLLHIQVYRIIIFPYVLTWEGHCITLSTSCTKGFAIRVQPRKNNFPMSNNSIPVNCQYLWVRVLSYHLIKE